MMKKLPKFKTEKEEANFWDIHSIVDYLEELEPVEFKLHPELVRKLKKKREEKVKITMFLNKVHLEAAKRISAKKGIPYQTQLRLWIVQGINNEK